jgi:hypothetical protein
MCFGGGGGQQYYYPSAEQQQAQSNAAEEQRLNRLKENQPLPNEATKIDSKDEGKVVLGRSSVSNE